MEKKTKMSKAVRVSINVNGADSSSESDSNAGTSVSDLSFSSTSSSGSGSQYGSGSGSESSITTPDVSSELLDHEDVLDKIEDLDEELATMAALAQQMAEKHIPQPVFCEQTLDVMLAWNDMVATLLRLAQTPSHLQGKEQDSTSEESDGDGSGSSSEEPAPPPRELLELNLDVPPVTGTALDEELQLAKAKCEAHAVDCGNALTAHGMLRECQQTDHELAQRKIDSDVSVLERGLEQLTEYRGTLAQLQRDELAAAADEVAAVKASSPSPKLALETAELATLVDSLPDGMSHKPLWAQQLSCPLTAQELLSIGAHVQKMAHRLTPEQWEAKSGELQALLAKADKATPAVKRRIAELENAVVGNAVHPHLLQQCQDLMARVRHTDAARAQRRDRAEMEVFVINKVHADKVRELCTTFQNMYARTVASIARAVTENQNKWQLACTRLKSECVYPLLELGSALDDKEISARGVVAYRQLRVLIEKDLEVSQRDYTEKLVIHVLSYLPAMQQLLEDMQALPDRLVRCDANCQQRQDRVQQQRDRLAMGTPDKPDKPDKPEMGE